jgi:hypothetical protein
MWRNSLAWTALAGALAAALLALAFSAPPAQSAERSAATPVTGGKTLLTLDSGTAAVLTDAGVSIRATGPAIGPAGSTVFAFPIVGGEVNKKQLSGKIVHPGGLAITAGGTTLVVKRFVIDLDSGFLTAKVAGACVRIPLLRLGAVTGGVQASQGVLVLRDGCQRKPDRHGGGSVEPDVRHRPVHRRPPDRAGHRHRHHQGLEGTRAQRSHTFIEAGVSQRGPGPFFRVD